MRARRALQLAVVIATLGACSLLPGAAGVTSIPAPSASPLTSAPAASPTASPSPQAARTTTAPSPTAAVSPTRTPTPTATPFYTQVRHYVGFTVKASAKVIPDALEAAVLSFSLLISGDKAVVERMRAAGVEIAVIAQSESVTDLPEYSYLRGRLTPDGRPYDGPFVRGLGGLTCVAAEENLLGLAGDAYVGENILVHECGHAVYLFGLDPDQRSKWEAVYAAAIAAGRWRDTYAATNAVEFFAELTQSYFALNPVTQTGIHNGVNGAAQLLAYEPSAYQILLAIFGPGR